MAGPGLAAAEAKNRRKAKIMHFRTDFMMRLLDELWSVRGSPWRLFYCKSYAVTGNWQFVNQEVSFAPFRQQFPESSSFWPDGLQNGTCPLIEVLPDDGARNARMICCGELAPAPSGSWRRISFVHSEPQAGCAPHRNCPRAARRPAAARNRWRAPIRQPRRTPQRAEPKSSTSTAVEVGGRSTNKATVAPPSNRRYDFGETRTDRFR